MKQSIYLTGSTGFVGENIYDNFKNDFIINTYQKDQEILIKEDIVIHLIGKAHDTKKIANSQEYYNINTILCNKFYDSFKESNAKVFITLSSVKAIADSIDCILTENYTPNPATHYGKSKLLSEQYILNNPIPEGKRVFILRPCMIHGPKNKGNLNLLYNIVIKGFPWPLGAFENKRSFCSIDNLCFIINELIKDETIPSGVYNVADDEALSTNDLVKLISESQGKKYKIWKVPVIFIKIFSIVGDMLKLPLNSERLSKLTETYVVSNIKIKSAINKPFPYTAQEGLMKTLNSFNKNVK